MVTNPDSLVWRRLHVMRNWVLLKIAASRD